MNGVTTISIERELNLQNKRQMNRVPCYVFSLEGIVRGIYYCHCGFPRTEHDQTTTHTAVTRFRGNGTARGSRKGI